MLHISRKEVYVSTYSSETENSNMEKIIQVLISLIE